MARPLRLFRLPSVALVALALAGPARAEDPLDAGAVTQPGRGLDKALDQALGALAGTGKRTLLLLVDANRSLREAGFSERLAQALRRQEQALEGADVGLLRCGAKGLVTVEPGRDRGALLADLGPALSAATTNPVRNVYADVRAAAAAFGAGSGTRRLLLVSLENGDVEDDLEDAVRTLERAKVTVDVIAREAYLADSYAWSHAGQAVAPKGAAWTGGDGAWPEIPWGWALQQYAGHEAAPSGFAAFGLSRLAAATGGRVHVYASSGGKHECSVYSGCSFCSSDHLPTGEAYQPHRVKALAPSVDARDDVLARDAHDPWVKATLSLWAQASKEGLVRSRPPVGASGGAFRLETRRAFSAPFPLAEGTNYGRLAKDAARLRDIADRLLQEFEADLAKIEPDAGSPRHRAAAETTRVLLQLTAVNLYLLEGWAGGAGPALAARPDADPIPPEMPRFGPDMRVIGWGYSTHCLCHGLAPYRAQRLSAGPELAARLAALDKTLQAFFARHDHTPFGIAVRRSGLSTFWPTVQGKRIPPPERRSGSTEASEPVTTERPGRGGEGSGESGPATTGK